MKKIGIMVMVLAAASLMACSSGSSSSDSGGGSTGATTITSLSQIPSTTSIFNSAASASISAAQSKAVTGTPPLLREITEANADTIFWDGLIATINGGETITQQIAEDYFEGEGMCRQTQTTGFLIQELQSFGTSMCYMREMPSLTSGITVTEGTDVTPDTIFDKGTADRVVNVNPSNMSGDDDQSPEDIFIKVYGNNTTTNTSDYWVDLWFCHNGTAMGYDRIRTDGSSNEVVESHYMAGDGQGAFYSTFTGSYTEVDGDYIYDTTLAPTAEIYDSFYGLMHGSVSVTDSVLTARNQSQMDGSMDGSEVKVYGKSEFTGSGADTLAFVQGGFAGENDFGGGDSDTFEGTTEWQNTLYASVGANGEYWDDVNDYNFTTDTFYVTTLAFPTEPATILAEFDCSTAPDVTVEMDGSQDAVAAVELECSPTFEDMNFCDGDDVQDARARVEAFLQAQP